MTLAYLLIIVIAFGAVAYSLMQLVGEYLSDRQSQHDRQVTESLVRALSQSYRDMDAVSMYLYAREFVSANGGRVLILDDTGTVEVDSESEYNGRCMYSDPIRAVLNGEERNVSRYDISSVNGMLYRRTVSAAVYASALYDGPDTKGVAVYISDNAAINESLGVIQNRILFWLVLVGVCTLLLTVITSHLFTEPMQELSVGISRMTKGDLSTRVRVHGSDEFAQLGAAFNTMTEQLEQLDTSRSNFVSNASHELKTPLSTMKILIESILYQEPFNKEMTFEFLGDVNREIDRLNRIVSDLLTLVGMDQDAMTLHMNDIRLRDILTEQVRRLGPLARENGITLEYSARESGDFRGDGEKLAQVLYNLLDNAIKYTPRGGHVHADLYRSGREYILRVKDTGIGIPADDQPHIFDRFYRVDKARSRATGGTGLGLSIVKQIIVMHGGDITLESREGAGSTFTVSLPIDGPGR